MDSPLHKGTPGHLRGGPAPGMITAFTFLLAVLAVLAVTSCAEDPVFVTSNPCDPSYTGPEPCPTTDLDGGGGDAHIPTTPDGDRDSGSQYNGEDHTGNGGRPEDQPDGGLVQPCLDQDGEILSGWCLIEGVCYRAGALDPDRECARCQPTAYNTTWSNRPDGAACTIIDGSAAGEGETGSGDQGAPHCWNGYCIRAECECGIVSPCCDGCEPIRAGEECFIDGLECTTHLCTKNGICQLQVSPGWCLDQDQCFSVDDSTRHCGQCGHRCADGLICSQGVCGEPCEGDLTRCQDQCVDLNQDSDHCGTCNRACLPGSSCLEGQCLVRVTGVTVTPRELILNKGQVRVVKATVQPPHADRPGVVWQSSVPWVATVDEDGTVEAAGGGVAMVTATTTDGHFSATCQVTVVVPVTGITISTRDITITPESQHQLHGVISPPDATDRTIIWSSSLASVATVDRATGLVTGHNPGWARVTATSGDQLHSATCVVTVTQFAPVTVSLNPPTITLVKGQQFALEAMIQPSSAGGLPITWSSSSPGTASVTDVGVVTGLKGGQATVGATINHEGVNYTGQSQVTVVVPTTGLRVEPPQFFLAPGEEKVVTAIISPPDATDTAIQWTSGNRSIARVNGEGLVTALSLGSTAITAFTQGGGGFSSAATVTVGIPVTHLELTPSRLELEPGETGTLTVIVNPDNATIQEVTWFSSNPEAATVETTHQPPVQPGEPGANMQTVKIKAVNPGTATITGTSHNGKQTPEAVIVVQDPT